MTRQDLARKQMSGEEREQASKPLTCALGKQNQLRRLKPSRCQKVKLASDRVQRKSRSFASTRSLSKIVTFQDSKVIELSYFS